MKEKLLFLTSRYPYPPHKGDTIRVYAILNYLSRFYEITLVAFNETAVTSERKNHLSTFIAQQIIWQEPLTLVKLACAASKSIALNIPIAAAVYESHDKRQQLLQVMQRQGISKIYVFSLALMSVVPASCEHVYLDLCDVEIFKWHDYAKMSSQPWAFLYQYETKKTWQYLKKQVKKVLSCFVISAYEHRLLKRIGIDSPSTYVLPNGIDAIEQLPIARTNQQFTLIFVGVMSYRPNIEAIMWFVSTVWPLIKERFIEVELIIVGQSPTKAIQKLARDKKIKVTGFVPDISEYLQRADLVIAPMKMAYGVQNKVLEALCFGKKLMATPQSMRGIDWKDEGIRVVKRDPNQWVDTMQDLKALSLTAEQLIAKRAEFFQRYHWEACLTPLKNLIEQK